MTALASCQRLAALGLLLASSAVQASDPIADRTCIASDSSMACYDVLMADLVLDSSARPLTSEAGSGFLRLGYVDSSTGAWVEVAATHYAWRAWTSWPAPRTLLVWVDDLDEIATGGFEGEYSHPMR